MYRESNVYEHKASAKGYECDPAWSKLSIWWFMINFCMSTHSKQTHIGIELQWLDIILNIKRQWSVKGIV